MRIAFFGSDRFSRLCLERILEIARKEQSIVKKEAIKIFCPPSSKGELLQYAIKSNISYQVLPPKSLKGWNINDAFDIGLTASIGYFIPSRVIKSFALGMLNAHPSLLPKYRGASPIQYTIMNGDETSGVSIIDLDSSHFDAGNVWMQEQLVLEPYMNFHLLEERLAFLAGEMLFKTINDFKTCQLNKIPQKGDITFSPKITSELAKISFKDMNSLEIFGRHQAIAHQERIFMELKDNNKTRIGLVEILDPRTSHVKMDFEQFTALSKDSLSGATFLEKASKTLWIKSSDNWLGARSFRIPGKSNTFDAATFTDFYKFTQFKTSHFL